MNESSETKRQIVDKLKIDADILNDKKRVLQLILDYNLLTSTISRASCQGIIILKQFKNTLSGFEYRGSEYVCNRRVSLSARYLYEFPLIYICDII